MATQKTIIKEQLGMAYGTARHRLSRTLMFKMAQTLGLTTCHQCDEEIERQEEFSTEHIEPWLHSDNPIKIFFDLDNITFSHQACNSGAARRYRKHGISQYKLGCRCDICKKAKADYRAGLKKRRKQASESI